MSIFYLQEQEQPSEIHQQIDFLRTVFFFIQIMKSSSFLFYFIIEFIEQKVKCFHYLIEICSTKWNYTGFQLSIYFLLLLNWGVSLNKGDSQSNKVHGWKFFFKFYKL